MEPLYTASVTATGGREGKIHSEDGVLDLALKIPKEMGGPGGAATNPEQLFAAGYAACFDGALNLIIRKERKKVEGTEITANVTIGKDEADDGYKLAVRLDVSIQGVDKEEAEELAKKAHEFCPYSKATRGNVDVTIITV
jgi:lipoyl-dependent peroxiredoxin